jgi:hypothetical protein
VDWRRTGRRPDTLDRDDRLSLQRADLDSAARLVFAIDEDGTGSALLCAATETRTREAEAITQNIEQCLAFIGGDNLCDAIDVQFDLANQMFLRFIRASDHSQTVRTT